MGDKQEGNQLLEAALSPPMGTEEQIASLRGKLGVHGTSLPAGRSVAVLFGSELMLGLVPHSLLWGGVTQQWLISWLPLFDGQQFS